MWLKMQFTKGKGMAVATKHSDLHNHFEKLYIECTER